MNGIAKTVFVIVIGKAVIDFQRRKDEWKDKGERIRDEGGRKKGRDRARPKNDHDRA